MIKFGTGGWRAVIGDDFIRENIAKVAEGVALLAEKEGKTDKPVMIGYDRRFLSPEAARWVAEVLCAHGMTVLFQNRSVPTPLVMFIVKDKKLHYGIEVTASHNPPAYNGLKLIVEEGRDADVACTERLEALIDRVDKPRRMPFEEALAAGLVVYQHAPFNDFLDSILSRLDVPAIRARNPRILFDPMHGSGTYPLMTVLYTARCTIDLINGNKDAYFGGAMPAPGREQLKELSDRVRNEKYDLGIAVDGDGDRVGIIDSDGTYIDANRILVMLYYYLHEYRGWKGPVVRNLATTHMLDKVAGSFGEACYEVPVGFKYISAKLDETDAVLGGESSGGLTVRGHIFGKDSIYASALFVEMISAMGKTPGEIYRELTERFGNHEMVEDNLRFRPEEKERIQRLLMVEKKVPDFGKKLDHCGYADGFKAYFADGSFLICRFSGTEPLLRIFAEDENAPAAARLIAVMKDFLKL